MGRALRSFYLTTKGSEWYTIPAKIPISAHPETPIFSKFSVLPKMGTELSAFKKMEVANYWSV